VNTFDSLNSEAAAFLLEWFREYGVAYPWGDSRDPWGIWVSEVMLQQTTVGAVEPRYRRWMKRFPTPESLAAAEEEEILREWEGLGYYNRARNLASAARELASEYRERIPAEAEKLRGLPGIGPYIASAIASFAFGRRCAAIDANGRRIAMRLAAREPWTSELESDFRRAVEKVMPEDNPGEMNAALMQLGQLICRSGKPLCGDCPLAGICTARSQGLQNSIPARRRQEVIRKNTAVAILIDKDRVLVQKRLSGIGKGLWVFPARADVESLLAECVPEGCLQKEVHSYTRYRENLEPQLFRSAEGARLRILQSDSGLSFTGFEDLPNLPMPTAYRRIASQLGNHGPKPG
jgi:A/G-specific adenine glycosylase